MTMPNTATSTQGPDTQQQEPDPAPQQQEPNPAPPQEPDPAPQQQEPAATPPQEPAGHDRLPDDHPLVRTLEAQKAEIRTLKDNGSAEVAAALKTHLVELHDITDEDAELLLTATDPAVLVKQVNRLLDQRNDPRQRTNLVPGEGDNPNAKPDNDMRKFTRQLFGDGD